MPQFYRDQFGSQYGLRDCLRYIDTLDGPALELRPMSRWQALCIALRGRLSRPWVVNGLNDWRVWRNDQSQTGRYVLILDGRLTQWEMNELRRVESMGTEPLPDLTPPPSRNE